jgi:hypothetical protein
MSLPLVGTSEHPEVLALLPVGDLLLEAGHLRTLDAEVVLDELVAEPGPQARVPGQGVERLAQCAGQVYASGAAKQSRAGRAGGSPGPR